MVDRGLLVTFVSLLSITKCRNVAKCSRLLMS